MPHTIVERSPGKAEMRHISMCHRSLLYFPTSHFLWVPVKQSDLMAVALPPSHLSAGWWMGLRADVGTSFELSGKI